MEAKEVIANALKNVVGSEEVHMETPGNEEFGDYSTNLPLTVAKKLAKNPREYATEIVEKLKNEKDLMDVVEKIDVAGPGFINFHLKSDVLLSNLHEIVEKSENYGKNKMFNGKKVIIEYSSPNIAKPFTIGHLRSTIIGDAIANLMDANGWTVLRDNHLGDWGTQFGKEIYAIKTWGNEKEIENSKNPVKTLVELYIKFHEEADKDPSLNDKAREWFKKLEEGDGEARALWSKCVEWSWQEFDRIYKLLGVSFSDEFNGGRGLGESFFEDKMKTVIDELFNKGLLKDGEEGARLVFFEDDIYPPAMILKKDGTTLYHTRDLATDKYRKEIYNPNLIINEVGAEQSLYFQQLYEIESMLGWFNKEQRKHISHGLYRFQGRKMATRKGDVIWLEDVLRESIERAKSLGSESEDLACMVGIGALKYNDLKRDPKSNIIFNWDDLLTMEGNSGPYLQYTYARSQSVLSKVKGKREEMKEINEVDLNKEELSVLRCLYHYSEVIENAAKSYSPNLLCNHLYDLAQKYNAFYNMHRILDANAEKEVSSFRPTQSGVEKSNLSDSSTSLGMTSNFRLVLTAATGQVLKNGLKLLGIQTPERM